MNKKVSINGNEFFLFERGSSPSFLTEDKLKCCICMGLMNREEAENHQCQSLATQPYFANFIQSEKKGMFICKICGKEIHNLMVKPHHNIHNSTKSKELTPPKHVAKKSAGVQETIEQEEVLEVRTKNQLENNSSNKMVVEEVAIKQNAQPVALDIFNAEPKIIEENKMKNPNFDERRYEKWRFPGIERESKENNSKNLQENDMEIVNDHDIQPARSSLSGDINSSENPKLPLKRQRNATKSPTLKIIKQARRIQIILERLETVNKRVISINTKAAYKKWYKLAFIN